MRIWLSSIAALLVSTAPTSAQVAPTSQISIPDSSKPQSVGIIGALAVSVGLQSDNDVHSAFTNVAVLKPSATVPPVSTLPTASPAAAAVPMAASATTIAETPASIACIYGLVAQSSGCNPTIVQTDATGGKNVIAIVDAFDDPNVEGDLQVFCNKFHLPFDLTKFQVEFASGKRPGSDTSTGKGWEIETSLDVQWAHAIAPDAKIILVEADSDSLTDLLAAVKRADQLVVQNGGGEVSLSWGEQESASETTNDAAFGTSNVVHFAATGDSFTVSYPASSPQVIGVGGTSIVRDPSGSFVGETPWYDATNEVGSGAGFSTIEDKPTFQANIAGVTFPNRGVADIAAVADPTTGVWVYDSGNANFSTNQGWLIIGGTSAATPIIAAIASNSGQSPVSGATELQYIYSKIGTPAYAHAQSGKCGPNGKYSSDGTGWNYCTGVGTPRSTAGL